MLGAVQAPGPVRQGAACSTPWHCPAQPHSQPAGGLTPWHICCPFVCLCTVNYNARDAPGPHAAPTPRATHKQIEARKGHKLNERHRRAPVLVQPCGTIIPETQMCCKCPQLGQPDNHQNTLSQLLMMCRVCMATASQRRQPLAAAASQRWLAAGPTQPGPPLPRLWQLQRNPCKATARVLACFSFRSGQTPLRASTHLACAVSKPHSWVGGKASARKLPDAVKLAAKQGHMGAKTTDCAHHTCAHRPYAVEHQRLLPPARPTAAHDSSTQDSATLSKAGWTYR